MKWVSADVDHSMDQFSVHTIENISYYEAFLSYYEAFLS
jgi:hypothetical protein